MRPFELCLPTKSVFGEGTVNKVGEEAKLFGNKAFVITYDEAFVRSIGLMDKVEASMAAAGVEMEVFYGVKSNPTIELAREIIVAAKAQQPDVIVALGGGSVIDTAKCVGVGATYDGDAWDFFCGKAAVTTTIPVMAVVTIPATSSEMNGTTVMSNDELKRKDGLAVPPTMCPKTAILDPELTYGIPLVQTGYSAVDIMSHLMEGSFGRPLDMVWAPFQDRYCQGNVLTIKECMERIIENPSDKEARATFMWVATYAWNGFYVAGLGMFDQTIHILGHSLSAFYDLPHGASMSLTILATMRYQINDKKDRFAAMGRYVFGITEQDDLKAAEETIAKFKEWFQFVKSPTTFAEAGIPETELEELAKDALETSGKWGCEEPFGYTYESCLEMFKLCL